MDPTDFFDVLSHLEARLVVRSPKIALLLDMKKPLFVILGSLHPQRCGTSRNEAGLVYLHGPLCTTGAVSLESSPHSHLPALYQGEKEV